MLFLTDTLRHAHRTRGTDKTAEMTADTLCADDARLTCVTVKGDGLMTTILTRHKATATTNATLTVDFRIDQRVAIKIRGQHEVRQMLADDFLKVLNTPREVPALVAHGL